MSSASVETQAAARMMKGVKIAKSAKPSKLDKHFTSLNKRFAVQNQNALSCLHALKEKLRCAQFVSQIKNITSEKKNELSALIEEIKALFKNLFSLGIFEVLASLVKSFFGSGFSSSYSGSDPPCTNKTLSQTNTNINTQTQNHITPKIVIIIQNVASRVQGKTKDLKRNAIIGTGLLVAGIAALIPNQAEALSASFSMDNENNRININIINDDGGSAYSGVILDIGLYPFAELVAAQEGVSVDDVLNGMSTGIRGPPSSTAYEGLNVSIDASTGYLHLEQRGLFPNPIEYLENCNMFVNYSHGTATDYMKGSTIADGINARTTGGAHAYADSNNWIAFHLPQPMKLNAIDLAMARIILNVTTEDYYVSDIGRTFQIVTCTNLIDASWTTNSTLYTITNELTSVSMTNNSDSCFFKLVETK